MPNPLSNHWYWHRVHDCPVYIRRTARDGVHYDLMLTNGSEWPSVARGVCKASELDPWPLWGLYSESLMETKGPDG